MNNSFASKIIKYLYYFLNYNYYLFFIQTSRSYCTSRWVKKVDFNWIILSMIFGALAYVSRGLRWRIMLEAIDYKTSNINNIMSCFNRLLY